MSFDGPMDGAASGVSGHDAIIVPAGTERESVGARFLDALSTRSPSCDRILFQARGGGKLGIVRGPSGVDLSEEWRVASYRKKMREVLLRLGSYVVVVVDEFENLTVSQQIQLLSLSRALRDSDEWSYRFIVVGAFNDIALRREWRRSKHEVSAPLNAAYICARPGLAEIRGLLAPLRQRGNDDLEWAAVVELVEQYTGRDRDLVEVVASMSGRTQSVEDIQRFLCGAHQADSVNRIIDRRLKGLSRDEEKVLRDITFYNVRSTVGEHSSIPYQLMLKGLVTDLRLGEDGRFYWAASSPIVRRSLAGRYARLEGGAWQGSDVLTNCHPVNVIASRLVAQIENLLRNAVVSWLADAESDGHPLGGVQARKPGRDLDVVNRAVRAVFDQLKALGRPLSDAEKGQVRKQVVESLPTASSRTMLEVAEERRDYYDRTLHIDHIEAPLVAYLELGELEVILQSDTRLKGLFTDREELTVLMRKVREIRNSVAHNAIIGVRTIGELLSEQSKLTRLIAKAADRRCASSRGEPGS